jgi:hypothetical protein
VGSIPGPDAVENSKILTLPGIEPWPSSPYLISMPIELSLHTFLKLLFITEHALRDDGKGGNSRQRGLAPITDTN